MNFLIWLMAFIGICVTGSLLVMWVYHIYECMQFGRWIPLETKEEYNAIMEIYKSHMHVKRHYESLKRNN